MPKQKKEKIEKGKGLEPRLAPAGGEARPAMPGRPPVVVVLGHVDHGKTTILDQIKKTKVAEKESGGITQHVGAYEVEYQGKKITFIDTPGHEAFSAMRARGAKVADIAILVVAADDGVKPQTKEAAEHIKKAGIPMIVAINKIDKPEAALEKVKNQLSKEGIFIESMGGEIPSVNVSAKTGEGIDGLLEVINLVAEMQELTFDPQKSAEGVVIEARLDPQRGPTATLLVREGILKTGDIAATGTTFGKMKILEDFHGVPLNQALASQPVVVIGFDDVPEVGDKFVVANSAEEAKQRMESKMRKREWGEVLNIAPGQKILNLILKVDVQGSLEPIKESLQAIPQEEVILRILDAGVGEITDSDVKLADASKATILGFRVNIDPPAANLAEQKKVRIVVFNVIYDLIQELRTVINALMGPEISRTDFGQVKILAIFRKDKNRMIVGGKVINGEARKGKLIEVLRNDEVVGHGKLIQLQKEKKEVDKVASGQECGILFEGDAVITEGDLLKIYEEEKKKREL